MLPPEMQGVSTPGVEAVLATRMAAEHRFPELAARVADGTIRVPTIQTFAFADAGRAFDLQATKHVCGKIAVLMH